MCRPGATGTGFHGRAKRFEKNLRGRVQIDVGKTFTTPGCQ